MSGNKLSHECHCHIYCLQDRFNGLTLLNIHNYMKIDREEIINRLAVKYPKRLRMLNMFEED